MTFSFIKTGRGDDEYYIFTIGCNGFMYSDLSSGEIKLGSYQPNYIWHVYKSMYYEGYTI